MGTTPAAPRSVVVVAASSSASRAAVSVPGVMVLTLDDNAIVVAVMVVNEECKQLRKVSKDSSQRQCISLELTNVMKKAITLMIPRAKLALSMAHVLSRW